MKSAPDYIQFYPTMRCNLSCDFCFNKSMPYAGDIRLEDFKALIDIMAGLNINTIDIMGGEPTLHSSITPMIEYATVNGLRVNLSSNGSEQKALSGIMEKFKKINVGISINKRQMLQKLKGFIGKYKPIVKTVFSSEPDSGLLSAILLLKPRKLNLLYQDVMKKEDIKNSVPFPQFLMAVQKLSKISAMGAVYCSGFIPDTANYPALAKTRCPAGTTKLGIMPDGSVYPCNLFFGIKEFILGNIFREPFEKIWNHGTLDFFRTYKGNACPKTECILHESCHGGCPVHGLIHNNDLNSPEPRCTALLV